VLSKEDHERVDSGIRDAIINKQGNFTAQCIAASEVIIHTAALITGKSKENIPNLEVMALILEVLTIASAMMEATLEGVCLEERREDLKETLELIRLSTKRYHALSFAAWKRERKSQGEGQ